MDGVAAEVAIEVRVRLEEHRWNPLTSQQEGQNHASRPAAHDTAGGLMDVANLMRRCVRLRLLGLLPHVDGHMGGLLVEGASDCESRRSQRAPPVLHVYARSWDPVASRGSVQAAALSAAPLVT